jgi:predicted  nucleic acid-binding Zn-ribbon protein
MGMYSAEVLSQLRSLNHLSQEIRRLPRESPEAVLLQTQIGALRARLPNSILSYHDRLAARGQDSAIKVNGESCSVCHLKLPRGLLGELAVPGRFGVCPNCGVFLWMGEKSAEPVPALVRKPVRRSAAKTSV